MEIIYIIYCAFAAECDKYLFLTEYYLVFRNHRIPNIEYYSVLRISEYRIGIVLFVLTIRIPNTKYRIVYKILEKRQLKSTYLSHTRHFVFKFFETIQTDIWTGI